MTSAPDDADRWQAWDRFVESTPETGFMQSSAWAKFRARVGFEHFAITLKDGETIVGGALVGKFTYQDGHCFYYVQEGPVLPPDETSAAEVFSSVMERVERRAQADHDTVSHLRIEPRWRSLPRFVQGFQQPAFSDRFREPRHTLCVDLRPSLEDIQARMRKNGRYNIRVALRHGVSVVEDNSPQGIEDFLRIQRRTAIRQAIDRKPPSYFRMLLSELGAQQRVGLYFAEYGGRRVATALVVAFGRRATYFFGGSLAIHRHVKAPDLLIFEMMRRAKAAGMDWCDLWGVAPPNHADHAWQHLSAFKRKFGGVEVGLVPTLDYVLDAEAYRRFQDSESSNAAGPAVVAPSQGPPRNERQAPSPAGLN
jgi:lipid II:glycine glycyltransferase (peptidoglycan interpeptide bridge formation enzyme)